ncbi:MAG: response regulator, partial [Candidatus Cloacimonetes bacterium]|nr:response regulator [Candidatus Cloacimonadota bacterium]
EWTFRALFDATDKIIEYQAVGRDITEKKLAEIDKENIRQQLLHSQKMEVVGRLAGGIAHDFNNLLTAIIGYAELISKKLTPANPLQNDLETIIACGNKASNLTKQFLAFSRKQIVEPKVLNINMIINDMYAMLHHIIGEDIDFINNPGTALQNTRIDKTQLEQVITNLVLNARDAISSGGRIIISTGNIRLDKIIEAVNKQIEPGEYVTLTVKDNGTGISPEIRSHLFEPFYTTKEQGKGSGLGLATVFDIVNQHNGYITVISELNKGSEFTLYFHPTAEKAEISYATTTEKELPGGHETILVAEDEPNIREFVCDILDEFGYKVIKAVNGQEALQKAAEFDQTIHLLVTDVVMPIMNGNELAEKLLPDFPRIKIIYMSGYTESSAIQKIVLETKSGFLQKPFSVSDLILKVRNILDN